MSEPCTLTIFPTGSGYRFHVTGRGTMHESPAVRDFVCGAMEDGAQVTLDLDDCKYLDSTFLGCLVILQRRGDAAGGRFQVLASPAKRKELLSPCHIDKVLKFATSRPQPTGPGAELLAVNLRRSEFCGHLLETHRTLARLDGPSAATFQRIADEIASDLAKAHP